jgi:hypothetical protein
MSKAPFTIDPYLTGISLAYKNGQYIADLVLPRIDVAREEYKYTNYSKAEGFMIPNTLIGRRGQAREIELTGSDATGATVDQGLKISVPQRDIDNAAGTNKKPLDRATLKATDFVALGRELRVATLYQSTSSYASGCYTTLSGSSQFSDADCDAVATISAALDIPTMRPNTMTLGRAAWTGLRTNPAINKAINKTSGDKGMASRQAIAELFELQNVYVGESWLNASKPGQAASLARVWGKHVSLTYINPLADAESGITFGWTAQMGQRRTYQRFNPDIGLDGGVEVKVGESVDEKIVANDCGYLFRNAVA